MDAVAWTADANESLSLSLVRAPEDRASLTTREHYEGFHPTFTYPIFGEDEKIYGYRNLNIDLKFTSGSLSQYLSIQYKDKLPSSSTVDDIDGILQKFILSDYTKDEAVFLKRVADDAVSFKPLGERIFTYTRPASTLSRKGKNVAIERVLNPEDEETVDFEVYHSTWDTPGFREYHRRMQLFILLYIEGGSYINEEEESWQFVVLYEKRKRRSNPDIATYHFIGYSSLYPFYCFPEKVRLRLSQFVILPPYQQEGHGSALYNAIYNYVVAQSSIAELTVEDPAEAFEDLRDRNDLKMLLSHATFVAEAFGDAAITSNGGRVSKNKGKAKVKPGKMGPPADKGWLERWRVELKIAARQFYRLTEMLILKYLDPADARSARAYRLQVKERLYRFNYEVLMQLDKKERQEKLEETFRSVREDYARILAMVH